MTEMMYDSIDNDGKVILIHFVEFYKYMVKNDIKDTELENKLKPYFDQITFNMSNDEFRQILIDMNTNIGLNSSCREHTLKWIEYLKKADDKFIESCKETVLIAKVLYNFFYNKY